MFGHSVPCLSALLPPWGYVAILRFIDERRYSVFWILQDSFVLVKLLIPRFWHNYWHTIHYELRTSCFYYHMKFNFPWELTCCILFLAFWIPFGSSVPLFQLFHKSNLAYPIWLSSVRWINFLIQPYTFKKEDLSYLFSRAKIHVAMAVLGLCCVHRLSLVVASRAFSLSRCVASHRGSPL